MLGAQILLGFQLHAPFQDAFNERTVGEKTGEIGVLCIMVVVMGILIAPSARHRIVERGEATPEFNRLVTTACYAVLFPFAVALGLDTGLAFSPSFGMPAGITACDLVTCLAIAFWFGPLIWHRDEDTNVAKERFDRLLRQLVK
ncbi:DUF6328 family protein [Rhizobium sp. Root708]|uniref:DUF6328 family protein n=1 Tax=Rhizobium sp. Root708 TaxID=1736592 RepID=UPI003FD20B1C